MPIYSKKEFAALTGQTTKTLATYIGRNKVVANSQGFIDTSNETNAAFYEIYSAKLNQKEEPKPQIPREETFIEPRLPQDSPPEDNGIPSLIVSDKRYKHALAKKTEADEEKRRLEIEKLKGEVVPTAPIEVLVFQFKQYSITQQKITYEAFLNEITHKYNISSSDMAYYRSFFIKQINDAMVSATQDFQRDLGTILSEYSVKRA